jgi:hypothetical protein
VFYDIPITPKYKMPHQRWRLTIGQTSTNWAPHQDILTDWLTVWLSAVKWLWLWWPTICGRLSYVDVWEQGPNIPSLSRSPRKAKILWILIVFLCTVNSYAILRKHQRSVLFKTNANSVIKGDMYEICEAINVSPQDAKRHRNCVTRRWVINH